MVKEIKKLVKEIYEYDKQNPPKLFTSSLIKIYDQDFNDFNFCVSVTVKVCLLLIIIT